MFGPLRRAWRVRSRADRLGLSGRGRREVRQYGTAGCEAVGLGAVGQQNLTCCSCEMLESCSARFEATTCPPCEWHGPRLAQTRRGRDPCGRANEFLRRPFVRPIQRTRRLHGRMHTGRSRLPCDGRTPRRGLFPRRREQVQQEEPDHGSRRHNLKLVAWAPALSRLRSRLWLPLVTVRGTEATAVIEGWVRATVTARATRLHAARR